MAFPTVSEELRLNRLTPPQGPVRMVLDTDAYNEIDDQFALVQSLLSPTKLRLEAVYAAPFHNARSEGPADGMEKSYGEILRILELSGRAAEGFAFRGATSYLTGAEPKRTDAVADLIERAETGGGEPLYVVAIGAITNIASALLLRPQLVERIVVVWLGGHPYHWPNTREFNLIQDPAATRTILDSGVPLVRAPCFGVASHLLTTLPDLQAHIGGTGPIGDYLVETFRGYSEDHFGYAKEIWDMAPIGWLLNEAWAPSVLCSTPYLEDDITWRLAPERHTCREIIFVNRTELFRDLYRKLSGAAPS